MIEVARSLPQRCCIGDNADLPLNTLDVLRYSALCRKILPGNDFSFLFANFEIFGGIKRLVNGAEAP